MVCAKLDWACYGGSQDALSRKNNSCADACGYGIVDTLTTTVPAFAGSKCAAFWSGVMMRHDTCISVGGLSTQVRFYKFVNYQPEIELDVTIFQHGVNSGVRKTLSTQKSISFIKLINQREFFEHHPMALARRGATYFCSPVEVDLSRTCGSVDLVNPLDIDNKCWGVEHKWNAGSATYDISFERRDAEKIVHDHYFACNENTNVSFDGYEASARTSIKTIELEIEGKYKVDELVQQWCPLGSISLDSKPGVSGFRSMTTIEITSDFSKVCDVEVAFDGCQPLQGALSRLKTKIPVRLEYYCKGNATRTVEVRNADEHKSFDVRNVKKNWAPLHQDMYNVISSGLTKMNPKGWMDDALNWCGTVDMTKAWVFLSRLFSHSLYKYLSAGLSIFVVYQSLMRGNLINAAVAFVFFYFLSFTTLVFSLTIDATVPVVGLVKFTRASVVWFVSYNLPAEHVVCDIVESIVYLPLFALLGLCFGFLFSFVVLQLVKGVHRTLTAFEFMDNSVYHPEVRLPLVKAVGRYVVGEKPISVDHRPDLYDTVTYIDRSFGYRDWFASASHVFCSDTPEPVPWETAIGIIKCREHSAPSINSAALNNGFISWEWTEEGLSLYMCAHVIQPPPGTAQVYGDVYVCSNRKALNNPPDAVLSGDSDVSCVGKTLVSQQGITIDPVGFSGSVLLSTAGNFYVVHEKIAQTNKLVTVKPKEILGPIDCSVECSDCMLVSESDGESGLAVVDEVMEIEPLAGPSREDDIFVPPVLRSNISKNQAKRNLQRPRIWTERPNRREEWKDYWGTVYDKQIYDNHFNYVCRDSPIYAKHVTDIGTREIYFDVTTSRQSINLACSSRESDCYYTQDGNTGRYMHQGERQNFLIVRGDILYVINCRVIYSKTKLVSGQCVYHWVSGWCPYYKENVRISTIITFGRKIGDLYYYAIMNGSSHTVELSVVASGLRQTRYVRNAILATTDFRVAFYDTTDFEYNRLTRLLNSRGEVIMSWTSSKTLEYDPTFYEYFNTLTNKFSPFVRAVPLELGEEIRRNEGVQGWFRKIEDSIAISVGLEKGEPKAIPSLVFASREMLDVNSILVHLLPHNDSSFSIKENLGSLLLRVSTSNVIAVSSAVNQYLWAKGCQVISYHGDLSLLMLDSSLNPREMFIGCEIVDTPCLMFISDNEGVSDQLRNWLSAEVPEAKQNMLEASGIRIHPDWGQGAAALRSNINSDRTLMSLERWKNIQAIEHEELLLNRNQTSTAVDDPTEICGVMPGDYWLGEVCSALDSGCCFGDNKSLVTSYHVTYGNDVVLTRRGMTYTWKKLVHESRQEDLVMYNSLFNFAKAEKGEILCVVCPIRKIGQYLIVENVGCNFAARNAAYFYEMRPINIIGFFNHIVSSDWKGIQGMSGSPIFNSDGQIVSVYGLGKIENRSIESSNAGVSAQPITALTVLAPECRANIVPENFFRTAVADLIDNELEEGNLYYLLEAPTGSGKTMSFTVNLMKSMGNNKKITLLQPTVAAVKSAFLRISELLDVEMSGANKYQILYTVGQQHEDSLDVRGNGNRKLHIMTYGTSLRHVREIEQTSNYVLLDEIHCRADPTVVAGDLQFTKRSNYKCVHLTATVLTRTRGQQLAVGLDISSTRFEIRENIRIEALSKDDKPDESWLVIKSNVMGVRCEGFKLGYKIPMQVLRKGIVVFFLSTRHDCNSLYNYCCRNYSSENRQMIVIHGGTSFKVADMQENCWCFCTDVVGQAVTIPGCRVVIDFLEEMKPSTVMYANNEGLIYNHTLTRRRIGQATSKQRV